MDNQMKFGASLTIAFKFFLLRTVFLILAIVNALPVMAQNESQGWCGQTITFDNNQLPTNWSSFLIRYEPGVVNNHLEGNPIDSGVQIDSTEISMSSMTKLVAEYDVNLTYSYWDQYHYLAFKTASGIV